MTLGLELVDPKRAQMNFDNKPELTVIQNTRCCERMQKKKRMLLSNKYQLLLSPCPSKNIEIIYGINDICTTFIFML